MDEPIVEEFYNGLQSVPNSLYIDENFQEHIEGLHAQHRWRIENLRTIIHTHRKFTVTESFDELQDYIANCNEQINSIRTFLNEKEERVNIIVFRLEEFLDVKVDIREDFRRYPQNISSYDKEFDEVDKNIEKVKYLYQLISSQLESLARFSLKAIDVLQEHKTAARSSFTVLLLRKSQSITNSLYATVNPRGEFEDFNEREYREHMLNAGMDDEDDDE